MTSTLLNLLGCDHTNLHGVRVADKAYVTRFRVNPDFPLIVSASHVRGDAIAWSGAAPDRSVAAESVNGYGF